MARAAMKRIDILTGGGDVPGLNSVIKSVVYCRAANVDLPLAAIPIRRTSASAGTGRETDRPPLAEAAGG